MIQEAVAKRYAAALHRAGTEKRIADRLEADFRAFILALEDIPELKHTFFYNKLIPPRVKVNVLKSIFQGRIEPTLLNFLCVIVEKRREELVLSVFEQYRKILNEARGILEAELESAVELSSSEIETIKARLEKVTGKQFRLQTKVNPSLLGGLIIRVGDEVIDGSVRGRLKRLEAQLKPAAFTSKELEIGGA